MTAFDAFRGKSSIYACPGQVVDEMAARLSETLRDASTSPSEAIEAVKHLLTLQADGARCVADCDPLGLYLDAQVRPHVYSYVSTTLIVSG